jgi:hypothetical protein
MCVHSAEMRKSPALDSESLPLKVKSGEVLTVTNVMHVEGRIRLGTEKGWVSATNASGFSLFINARGMFRRALEDTPLRLASSVHAEPLTRKDLSSMAEIHAHANNVRIDKDSNVIVPKGSVFECLETCDIVEEHTHHGHKTKYINRRLRLQLGGSAGIGGWVPERKALKRAVPYGKMARLMEPVQFVDGCELGPLPRPPGKQAHPGKSGWMDKNWTAETMGARHHKNWQRRWFELRTPLLTYATESQENGGEMKGAIDLSLINIVKLSEKTWSDVSKAQLAKSGTIIKEGVNSQTIELHQGDGKIYYVRPQDQEMDTWKSKLEEAIAMARARKAEEVKQSTTHSGGHHGYRKQFVSDANFRSQELQKLKDGLQHNVERIWSEMHDSPEMIGILNTFAEHGKLTRGETLAAQAQLKDLCEMVGTGPRRAQFAVLWQDEHGAALLPLVAQLLREVPGSPLDASSSGTEEGVPPKPGPQPEPEVDAEPSCIKTARIKAAALEAIALKKAAAVAVQKAAILKAKQLEAEAELEETKRKAEAAAAVKKAEAEAAAAAKEAEEKARQEALVEAAKARQRAEEQAAADVAAALEAKLQAEAEARAEKEAIRKAAAAKAAADKKAEEARLAAEAAKAKAEQERLAAAAAKAAAEQAAAEREAKRLADEKAAAEAAAKAAAEAEAARVQAYEKAEKERRAAEQEAARKRKEKELNEAAEAQRASEAAAAAKAAEDAAAAATAKAAAADKALAEAVTAQQGKKDTTKKALYETTEPEEDEEYEEVAMVTLAAEHEAALQPRSLEEKQKDKAAAHQGEMGKRLQAAKAKVGALTCSLMWNNMNDLDLHCVSPTGSHIFYANRKGTCTGHLDVDMNAKENDTSDKPIENILWYNPPKGHYKFWIEAVDMDRTGGKTPFSVRLTKQGIAEDKHYPDLEEDEEQVVFEFDL